MRKHTWKVVSPTAPRFSTFQQCSVYLEEEEEHEEEEEEEEKERKKIVANAN